MHISEIKVYVTAMVFLLHPRMPGEIEVRPIKALMLTVSSAVLGCTGLSLP